MEVKGRIQWIDAIKGFAILLVVIGHAIAYTIPNILDIVSSKSMMHITLLWRWIYSFHMPLFFFISGFLFYRSQYQYVDFFWRKVKRLLVPYFFIGVIGQLLHINGWMWFFLSLFEFSVIALWIDFISKKVNRYQNFFLYLLQLVVILLFMLVGRFRFDFELLNILFHNAGYIFPFFLGMFVKKEPWVLEQILKKRTYSVALVLYLFSFILLIAGPQHLFKGYEGSIYNLCWISGVFLFFNMFSALERGYLFNILAYLGKYTMGIYVFHSYFLLQIDDVKEFFLNFSPLMSNLIIQVCYYLFISIISITFSLLTIFLLKRSNVLKFLVLGEKID